MTTCPHSLWDPICLGPDDGTMPRFGRCDGAKTGPMWWSNERYRAQRKARLDRERWFASLYERRETLDRLIEP